MLEFSDKKVVGTVEVPLEITESDVMNVIVTALEGGSNYWIGLDNSKPEFDDRPKGEPLSTWVTKLILDGKTVTFYDIEDKDDRLNLTLSKLLNGIKLNSINRKHDCDLENMDATTADCIVQYALFGKVVFG